MIIAETKSIVGALFMIVCVGACQRPSNEGQERSYMLERKEDGVYIVIANYENVWNYEVATNGKVSLFSSAKNYIAATNAMAIMFRERKESERRRASDAEMRKNTITDIQWSEASPDKKYLIVGYENPVVRSMKNASLFRLDTLTISHIVRTDSLVDVGWMNNSATLLILERYGKYSKKPSGILGALAGHPISIATYRLRAIDILSGSQTCEIVQTGVEQSIAEIRKNPIRSKNPSDGK